MISRNERLHWIVDQKRELEPNSPLDTTHANLRAVHIRNNASSSFKFDVCICPLKVVRVMEIELHRTVSGHRCRLIKRHKPNVDRHILILVMLSAIVCASVSKSFHVVPPYE